jgi:hypothetical protein
MKMAVLMNSDKGVKNMKGMIIIPLTLLIALIVLSPKTQLIGSSDMSPVCAADQIFEPYAIHHREGHYVKLKAGQILKSVKVYSPNKKYYAYTEVIADKTLTCREDKSPQRGGRTIIGNTSDGSEKVLFQAKPKPNLYANPHLQVEDWMADSSTLIFSEGYFEGGVIYHIYAVEQQKLYKIPDAEKYGGYGLASKGWLNGKFILRDQGGNPKPEYFQWDPASNKLVQMKEPPKGELKRWGLVRKGDREIVE